jgi:glucosamine 6-phosphate synthetase-like amidotransferase/phosphosugar isomerase protein
VSKEFYVRISRANFKLRGKIQMCGIFGFALTKTMPLVGVFKLLEKLEVHQYPEELKPVGGYGAGVAILLNDGSVLFEKVGKINNSPVRQLAKIVNAKVNDASVLIGHVRMPSPEFMESAKFKETAQPYVVELDPNLTIVSVHNGKVENYKELREKLGKEHVFESEKVELIDSEVIPHYFEELLNEIDDIDEALYTLFCALKGSNAIAMLQIDEENTFLHLIHKGKTRGLTVWTNERNEVIFCSRKEPLIEEFNNTLVRGKFKEKVSIAWREDVGLKLSFPVSFRVKG